MAYRDTDILSSIETLLNEFHHPGTSNERKAYIEQQLNAFGMQRDSWKLCIPFLRHSTNQYVSMFALQRLEYLVTRQWNSLEPLETDYLKEAIKAFVFELGRTLPYFTRNKLAKLAVELAKQKWPSNYLDHYQSTVRLLQSPQDRVFGLVMLRTTSEEMLDPSSDLASSYKQTLSALGENHIPHLFQVLTEMLEGLAESQRRRNSVTTTPPPSPTNPSPIVNSAPNICATSFRPDRRETTREILETLQHIFSWVNLVQVPYPLVYLVFQFTNIADDDMCLLAISVLNEILYRRCAPPGTRDLFLQIYEHSVLLLRDISYIPTGIELSFCFVDKLCEMLSLLVELHLWRLEMAPFNAVEFLRFLFSVTLQVPQVDCYLRCLSVWACFIRQLKPQNKQTYSEALVGLAMAVINKMLFTNNHAQLEDLENIKSDVHDQTEWQVFLNASIDIIATVSEFAPIDTVTRVLMQWTSTYDVYITLRTADVSCGILKLETGESQRLHCYLKDLGSLTQTMAHLSTHFMDPDANHPVTAPTIQGVIHKLVECAELAGNGKFYHLAINDTRLIRDFTQVHCHLLSALKTWCGWYNVHAVNRRNDLMQLVHLVLPVLRAPLNSPPGVTLAAAHLLLGVTAMINPMDFVQMPEAVELMKVASTLRYPNNQSRDVTLCAFAVLLIKPWSDLNATQAEAHFDMIDNLFTSICREYRKLDENCADAQEILDVTMNCLPCLANVVKHCKEYPSLSKKYLYIALKATFMHSLKLLSTYTKYPEVVDVQFQFFVCVLEVLQLQMGVEGVQQAVDVFLGVALGEQQRKNFGGIDMFLKVLQLVIEGPGTSYKQFILGIFELSMKHIYPSLMPQANEYPDAIIALINLLHSVLLNRWNFFYVSQIRLGNSPGCSDVAPAADSPKQQQHLLLILQILGHCLLQSDINVFRVSLHALENVNAKWKLYHKALFKEQMLGQFLNVLLQTLLEKTHELLSEEIALAFYNMASVSFPLFFSRYLPHYIDSMTGLDNQQQNSLRRYFNEATDAPTFMQDLQRFVNDARCYLLSNGSMPSGTNHL